MAAGMTLHEDADLTLPKPMYQAIAAQVGRCDRLFAHRNTLSLMVKIRAGIGGKVGPRWVNKSLQAADRAKFKRGIELARDILLTAGARRIFRTWHFAAHPGGSGLAGDVPNDFYGSIECR
jgi:hypothetical protein